MLFLWGKCWSFFVSVDCSLSPPCVQLSACGQDEPIPLHRPLLSGNANNRRVWHVLVSRMLEAEGFELARVEDFEWFNQLVMPQLEVQGEEALKRLLAQRKRRGSEILRGIRRGRPFHPRSLGSILDYLRACPGRFDST